MYAHGKSNSEFIKSNKVLLEPIQISKDLVNSKKYQLNYSGANSTNNLFAAEKPIKRVILDRAVEKVIKKIVNNNEMIKIPVFPKLQFGKHIEMAKIEPEYFLLPKHAEEDVERIKQLKREGGRIPLNFSCVVPKKKYKGKKKIEKVKIFYKKFWFGPGGRIKVNS